MSEESYGLKPSQLEPLHDYVILKLVPAGETPGGLTVVSAHDAIVPAKIQATAQKEINVSPAARAEVIAVGPKVEQLVKGDVVIMPPPRALGNLGDNMFLVQEPNIQIRYHITGVN